MRWVLLKCTCGRRSFFNRLSEGDLIGAPDDGDAVGNESLVQDVPSPRDAEGLREGGDFAMLAAGGNDAVAAGEGCKPRREIVNDGGDAAGGRLRLTCPLLDDAPVEIHGGPVEPGDFVSGGVARAELDHRLLTTAPASLARFMG